jgi:hypothetical protein
LDAFYWASPSLFYFVWNMKIYYNLFIIKISDVGLSFLLFGKGQKKHTGYFNNLKVDFRNVTNSMTFSTKSTNQNVISFPNKIQTTIFGLKSCDFLAILDQLTHFLIAEFIYLVSTPTFSAQFPLHGKHLQKNWPSGLCPNGLSCIAYHATSDAIGTELPGCMKTVTLAHTAGAKGLRER